MTAEAYPVLAASAIAALFLLFCAGYRMLRSDATETLAVEDLVLLRAAQRAEAEGMGPLERLAARLVPMVRRSLGPSRTARLQRRIDAAGRPDGLTVDIFLRRVTLWGLLCLPLSLVLLVEGRLGGALIALALPALLPLGRLAGAHRRRRDTLDRDLPDFLDVLAVTVTAGVAFRPALARVSERFEGPVADEIVLTLGQLGNGASLRQAFEALRERASSDAMSQFVTALLQSEELGAPLADTLNQIALDMRRDNAQRMRRKAAQAAPRVTLVTSLVLVPAALVLVISAIIVGSRVDFGALLA
jgi:tight adherence protein C